MASRGYKRTINQVWFSNWRVSLCFSLWNFIILSLVRFSGQRSCGSSLPVIQNTNKLLSPLSFFFEKKWQAPPKSMLKRAVIMLKTGLECLSCDRQQLLTCAHKNVNSLQEKELMLFFSSTPASCIYMWHSFSLLDLHDLQYSAKVCPLKQIVGLFLRHFQ